MSCAACCLRNFNECPESYEGNCVTIKKLSHNDALAHTEALFNYLVLENENILAEKLILRYLHS